MEGDYTHDMWYLKVYGYFVLILLKNLFINNITRMIRKSREGRETENGFLKTVVENQ